MKMDQLCFSEIWQWFASGRGITSQKSTIFINTGTRISNPQCVNVLAPCGRGRAADIWEEHAAFIILCIHCAKVLPGTSPKFSPHPWVRGITPSHI